MVSTMFNLDDCIAFVTCKGAKDLADCLETASAATMTKE